MGVLQRALQAPVTSLCLVLLAMMFAATFGPGDGSTGDLHARQRTWGLVLERTWVIHEAGRSEVWYPDLSGPFDLWNGEWWRIPLSTLHHTGFLHLFLNSLFVATFGYVLEREWGSFAYLIFLVGAAVVCPLPEYWLEQYPVGFSGVACAIFGALWGLRASRPGIAALISSEQIVAVLGYLIFCVVLTELDLIRIANLSHFTGLGYGFLAGRVFAGEWLPPRVWQAAFLTAHLLLILPYARIITPEANGRYHWYLATVDAGKVRDELDPVELERAVAAAPEIGALWQLLAENHLRHGRQLEAWEDLLHGIAHDSTRQELWAVARPLWRRLAVSPQREAALTLLRQILGEHQDQYLAEIRRTSPPPLLIAPDHPPAGIVTPDVAEATPWTASPDSGWWRQDAPGQSHPLLRNTEDAVEGWTL